MEKGGIIQIGVGWQIDFKSILVANVLLKLRVSGYVFEMQAFEGFQYIFI